MLRHTVVAIPALRKIIVARRGRRESATSGNGSIAPETSPWYAPAQRAHTLPGIRLLFIIKSLRNEVGQVGSANGEGIYQERDSWDEIVVGRDQQKPSSVGQVWAEG